MQKLYNLADWMEVSEGKALKFSTAKPRMIRLDVNAPNETTLYYKRDGETEARFLAIVKGRETIEFGVRGPIEILPEGGSVFFHVDEGHFLHYVNVDGEVFTKLHERRQRNHQLELIQYQAEQNAKRRMAALEAEFMARLEAAQAKGPTDANNVPKETPAAAGKEAPKSAPVAEGETGTDGEA